MTGVKEDFYLLTNHRQVSAKSSAMMTLNRSMSSFTSYVDIGDDTGDTDEAAADIAARLLEGESEVTRADRVCLYACQSSGWVNFHQ